jgi:hypothetical protein
MASIDPVPVSALPSFISVTTPPPAMPPAWTATVLLHPFSPPPSGQPLPDTPFFQLCTAIVDCVSGEFLSVRLVGADGRRWWYMTTAEGTLVSTDNGASWQWAGMGWTVPNSWYGAQGSAATCAGASPLNWMAPTLYEWWKLPVAVPGVIAPGATWMWFDAADKTPFRMMFGSGPPTPVRGDPAQLAFFQMFAFSYFASFAAVAKLARPTVFALPQIPGFALGNPQGFRPFVWRSNTGMTVFSTPVNENYNPLPTRILYVWKPDSDYRTYADRAQSTVMHYTTNPAPPDGTAQQSYQEALLTGAAPAGSPPAPASASGFLYTLYTSGKTSLLSGSQFPFAQEPPDWLSAEGPDPQPVATITDHPRLCPGTTITIYGVLFPPSAPNYPEATYLWTWYAPLKGSHGSNSRPVTFMQSQSGVGVGTSLALNDYFYFEQYETPIDPGNFAIPTATPV